MFPRHQHYIASGGERNKRQRERDEMSASVEKQSVLKRNTERKEIRELTDTVWITYAIKIFFLCVCVCAAAKLHF